MNNYLDEVYNELMRIYRLKEEQPLSPYEKEIVEQAYSAIRNICQNLEEELSRMKKLIGSLEQSRTFARVTDGLYATRKEKQHELEVVEEITRVIRAIMQ